MQTCMHSANESRPILSELKYQNDPKCVDPDQSAAEGPV